ncbi:MAG: histidine phosphatase family protein [Chloroflexi bacterium]|nr:histidine phosphatase family protein [Chloroflexota bacterium]
MTSQHKGHKGHNGENDEGRSKHRLEEVFYALWYNSYPMSIEHPINQITFLRHGESVGNLENRFQGHADFPLTERGRAQARLLAERWQAEGRTFDRAFSSPLARARETAEIVCGALGVPLEFDNDLMEINNGLLAGLNDDEAADILVPAETLTAYTHFGKTGESPWELYLRAGRVIQKLIDAPPEKILVVAHGGTLKSILYAILGIPIQPSDGGVRFAFENTTFATFSYNPARHNWRMLAFDDRSHWKEE